MEPRDFGIGRLFEHISDAVIVADTSTGRIVLWNRGAAAIFGYSAAEARDLPVDALIPEQLRAAHWSGMERYRATGHGQYIDSHTLLDLPAVRRDGAEIRIEMTLSALADLED